MLRGHRKAQLEDRMLMGAGYDDSDVVFAMPDGRPWNPDSISQAIARLVAASPLPRIRLHATSATPTPLTYSPPG